MKSYKANKKQQPRSLIHEISDTAVLVSVYFLIAIFHMSIKWKASGSWVMSVNQSVEQQWYCHQDVQSLWITCKVQQRGWFVLGKWRVPFKISEKLKQKLPVFKHQNREYHVVVEKATTITHCWCVSFGILIGVLFSICI